MLKFVTTNRHKFKELRQVATRFDVALEMFDLSYREIQSEDLAKIAVDSARACAESVGGTFFLEDAGLFVHALGGFPGPYSSFVHEKIGNQGILDLLRRKRDRSAHFLSVICYHDGRFHTYEGRVEGEISTEGRGGTGFGFDPIFIPSGFDRTFAEMGDEKVEISHRTRSSEIFFRSLRESALSKVL